jgi:hypothetical protein
LNINFNDLQKKYDELRETDEKKIDHINRYKILLSTASEKINGINVMFGKSASKKKSKIGEPSKRNIPLSRIENPTDSEYESDNIYAGASDDVSVFGRDITDNIEALRDNVSMIIERNNELKFENLSYSRGVVDDNINYNYTKGIIKNRIDALLPDRFKPVWNILMEIFGDRFLAPFFIFRDSLYHILVTISVIGYMRYVSDYTLYCTIA